MLQPAAQRLKKMTQKKALEGMGKVLVQIKKKLTLLTRLHHLHLLPLFGLTATIEAIHQAQLWLGIGQR